MPATILLLPLRRVPSPQIETRDDRTMVNPDTGRLIIVGETQNPRIVFMVVSICCLITLSLFLGKCTEPEFGEGPEENIGTTVELMR